MTEFLIANMAPLMFASHGPLPAVRLPGGVRARRQRHPVRPHRHRARPAPRRALPGAARAHLRHHGQNDTLLAIPFFTFMGLILERSGMAEDLLDTIGQLFGPIRGGLAFAVIFVGALLAATTGVVAASVISMGLISLPIMLRYGYDRRLASGVIAASGTLAQIIPPSLVLIVMADQLGAASATCTRAPSSRPSSSPACTSAMSSGGDLPAVPWCPPCRRRRARSASPMASKRAALAGAADRFRAVARRLASPARSIVPMRRAIGRDHRVGHGRHRHRLRRRDDQPRLRHRPAVAHGRARDLRADPAAGADLPRAGHHLPRRRDADRGRRDGRARRACSWRSRASACPGAAQAGDGLDRQAVVLRRLHPDRLARVRPHLLRRRWRSGSSTC
jgi:hypothetical protein